MWWAKEGPRKGLAASDSIFMADLQSLNSNGIDLTEGVHPLPHSAHSPKRSSSPTSPASTTDKLTCSLSSIIHRIDPGATIDAIVKMANGATMIRITPSCAEGSYNTRFLALQAALRLSFPFDTVSAVENISMGTVQIQILVQEASEQLQVAKRHVKSLYSMRSISAISNLLFLSGLVSFIMLLQHELISTPAAI